MNMHKVLYILPMIFVFAPLAVHSEPFKLPAPLQVEGSYKHEELGGSRPAWTELNLHANSKLPSGQTVYGNMAKFSRYNIEDDQFVGGVYWPFGAEWLLNVEANTSPSANFLPQWYTTAKMQRIYPDTGWLFTGGFAQTQFEHTEMTQFIIAIERYWSDFRGIYTLMPASVQGAGETLGHDMLLSYYYKGISYVGFGITSGSELEYDGTPNPPYFNSNSMRLTGRHWIDPVWAVSYDIEIYQTKAYTRQGVNIGLRHKF